MWPEWIYRLFLSQNTYVKAFLFIGGLFNDAVSSSDYLASKDRTKMNWKGYGRKRWWLNLRYCPGICVKGLRKTTKNLRINRSLGRDLNPGPTECEVAVLTTGPWLYLPNVRYSDIRGSHGSEDTGVGLLGCNAVSTCG
jgi:hypothetical protein